MTPKSENPFFVLKFGKRLATENMVIGFVPWILLTAVEIEFCVLAVNGQSMEMSWVLIIGQIFLLGPILGYFAQLQGIRCLENIFRRVRYEELMVTPVNGDNFIQFSLSRIYKASCVGLVINLVAGSAPLLYFACTLKSQQLPQTNQLDALYNDLFHFMVIIFLSLITLAKITFTIFFQRHAFLIGVERLLKSKAYIVPRLMALGRIITELNITATILLPILIALFSFEGGLILFFITLSFSNALAYPVYLVLPATRKRHYELAYNAIEKWRLHEDV